MQTVNDERSGAAASFRHHVAGHAGVVGGVRESGLFDDQVVIDGDQEIGVLRWIYDILILQPVHLERHKRRTLLRLMKSQGLLRLCIKIRSGL